MRATPSPSEVEAYLHKHIPLSSAMGVAVTSCDASGVTLRAPLAPNINHRATVFGGSASAVAILAAWAWLHFSLRTAGHTSRLVVQRNTVNYLAPIKTDFEARCAGLSAVQFEKFLKTLDRHGKARATLEATLICEGEIVADFSGEFVAVRA